jgi:hypothetical protein
LKLAVFGCALAFGQALFAQARVRPNSEPRDPEMRRAPETSELANENYNRAAASAAQIKTVLAKDAGLMVELKRWVAEEATGNGQIVDDADLSDDAIFDRLNRDIAFRSVATRLLQRYGYLLPAANPDSDLGKEQEFVLKERARRMVALEMQDNNSLRPGEGGQQGVERAACDPGQDETCDGQQSSPRSGGPVRNSPASAEENNPAPAEPPPSVSEPRTLRARSGARREG